ncbi:GGDEF domain-containing protein [Aeromonas enteropelogenes]|uniref:GGDEF domain-containing protein n=1 Tax=Aeromonas enteropelogenes TaxID=29489 RepID=UPI00191D56D8|nr:GGDEF domain-containing protein [Aeromonas enteropelogenes]MBL0522706.1 GGDEF domain-containing protein [Aeromonas enteropelogenes]
MTQSVTHQVKQAIMVQLYTHALFSLPCLGLLAFGWSLLFHDYLPVSEALGWLAAVFLLLLFRYWHLRWRQPALRRTAVPVLEREMFIGVTVTSIIWALGVLLYMDKLPDTYRAAMMMLTSLILTGSAIMLFGSRRIVYGAVLPLGLAMLFELGVGNEQERIVSTMLAGYLFVFLPTLLRRLRRDQVASLYHRFSNADLVAELKAVSEHLRLTSRLDGLTGIANRAHLDDCLERAWRRCHRARAPLSLVLLDVDYFKQFNDFYGHQLGDDCLQQVGRLLAGVERREDDLAARYGGEEFALLLPCTGMQGALQVADRIRTALKELGIPHQKSLVSSRVTCSFGVATLIPDNSMKIADLIQKADAALYQAKHNGRDRIEVALMGKVA